MLCALVVLFTIAIPFGRSSRGFIATAIPGWRKLQVRCRRRANCMSSPILARCRCRAIRRTFRTLIRKRSYAPTREAGAQSVRAICTSRPARPARAIPSRARSTGKQLARFGAEFIVQVPRDLSSGEGGDARWFAGLQFDRRDYRGFHRRGPDQAGRSGRTGKDCQRRRQYRRPAIWATISA